MKAIKDDAWADSILQTCDALINVFNLGDMHQELDIHGNLEASDARRQHLLTEATEEITLHRAADIAVAEVLKACCATASTTNCHAWTSLIPNLPQSISKCRGACASGLNNNLSPRLLRFMQKLQEMIESDKRRCSSIAPCLAELQVCSLTWACASLKGSMTCSNLLIAALAALDGGLDSIPSSS